MLDIKRREFISLLGGAAAAWPLAARAQQPSPRRRPVLGYLITGTKVGMAYLMAPFLNRLREIGYNEGQNIDIVTRYADADITRLAVLADELVRSQPNVIVAIDPPAALAAKKATASLPIVAAILNDPMRLGLIASYARPGGNVTGILSQVEGLPGKHVEIARELFPTVAVIGVLVNPANATHQYQREEVEAAAEKSVIKVIAAEARSKADLDAAFRVFDSAGVRVAVVLRDFVFSSEFQSIAELRRPCGWRQSAAKTPMSRPEGSSAMEWTIPRITAERRISSIEFSKATSRPTCLSSFRRSS
jgi:putative ABC transport system substrate-binding protein